MLDPPVDAAPPPVLAFAPGGNTQQAGGTGGQPYEDACPVGQVLVGFYGELRDEVGWHGLISGLCGAATLVVDGGGGFDVTIRAGATLPARGLSGGTAWMRSCPADQIVMGFGGRSGLYIDQLIVHCAPLRVTGGAEALSFSLGTVTALSPAGGTGGDEFPDTACPSGQIARTMRVLAGDDIDAFGLGCAIPLAN